MAGTEEIMANQQFLQTRKTGIGGSDIAAILGVSKFKTALDVFLSKTTDQPEEENELFYWGHALENPIIDRFVKETGFSVLRQPETQRSTEHEFLLANADALILDEDGKPQGILEIKTSSAYKTKEWSVDDGEAIPLEYSAQVQWYMGIFDVDFAYLAVLIGGNQYRHYRIERDKELFGMMRDRAVAFWQNHVLTGTPPAPQNAEDVQKLYPQDDGGSKEADSETLQAYNELCEIKTQIKALETKKAAAENILKEKIGEAAQMQHNGEKLFTWKTQSSSRFNSSAFKAEYPDLYKAFSKTTESRVFRA